ncbi:3104_t:CDS:2, partial [Acaulospora colombiana]
DLEGHRGIQKDSKGFEEILRDLEGVVVIYHLDLLSGYPFRQGFTLWLSLSTGIYSLAIPFDRDLSLFQSLWLSLR